MTVSVSLVETTRPEALTTAATQIGGKVAQLNSTIDAQRSALRDLQGGWQGTAADAALGGVTATWPNRPDCGTD